MTTINNETELYWEAYIEYEFKKNIYLYAEFPMFDTKTYYHNYITLTNGLNLSMIDKGLLLKYIVNYINKNLPGSQYTVSITGKSKSEDRFYTIVVSIIQTSDKNREKIE